jgi:hypothetical protein
MNAEHEKACRDLVAFIGQPMPDEMRAGHIKGIGNYLFAEGGAALLREALEKVRTLGADMALFEKYWRRE